MKQFQERFKAAALVQQALAGQGHEQGGGFCLAVDASVRIKFDIRKGVECHKRLGVSGILQQGVDVQPVIEGGSGQQGHGLSLKAEAAQHTAGFQPGIPLGIPGGGGVQILIGTAGGEDLAVLEHAVHGYGPAQG